MKSMHSFSIWSFFYVAIFYLLASCEQTPAEAPPAGEAKPDTEISFITSDSLTIFGDFFPISKEATTLLLFHQGGSNTRGEYGPIIPRLQKEGFNILTIDQRRGGQTYGRYNRTVARFDLNQYSYCDAMPDLEGALGYLDQQGYTGKKILWGSSYSAALVIRLGHEHSEEVSAVLAFSPASGGPMEGCNPNELFETLEVPLLVLRPGNEAQIESVQQQLAMAEEYGHQTYVAEQGVHGSSMLVEGRAKGGTEECWEVVMSFVKENK